MRTPFRRMRRPSCSTSSVLVISRTSAISLFLNAFFPSLLEKEWLRGDVQTVDLDEPVTFNVLLHFFDRQSSAGLFQNLCCQYPIARDGMLGEVGFDCQFARIDWQFELRPLLCCFWCDRVPPLRTHLLTPILDLRIAMEKFCCLAITLMLRDPPFFFWRRSSLLRQ